MSDTNGDARSWTLFGSVGAALGAAICCLGPVVLVSLGVTGAWIGKLSAVEPYRPFFMLLAGGLLGFAFYREYGGSVSADEPSENCNGDEACEVPGANRANRAALWVATVAVVGLFASPYLLNASTSSTSMTRTAGSESPPAQSEKATSSTGSAELSVHGMTCGGCVRTVTTALEDVDGVESADVTLEPPRARVRYHPDEATVSELTAATARVGFESKPLD